VLRIRIPDPGVKKHLIPDPDPQHCVFMSRFLLGEVGDDERDESLIDDRLNLSLVSRRDVGEEPNCFLQTEMLFLNAIFSRGFFPFHFSVIQNAIHEQTWVFLFHRFFF
jgi:hypothetical protein